MRTEEQVIRIGTITPNLEDLNHIEELPVDVSHHRDWGLDVDDIALFHEQLLGLGAYCFDDRVGEEFFLVEPGDAFVEVDTGWRFTASVTDLAGWATVD